MFVAMTHSPGCLPDTAEELPTFDTAAEAWIYLADALSDEEGWTVDDEDDPEGPQSRSALALALERNAQAVMADGTSYTVVGTLVGPDGYCYSVEYAEED